MASFMKNNLVHYGEILCLDAKKRQYNIFGLPYITSCVKSGDMCIAVTSDAIIITEGLDLYAWILNPQEDT